MTITEAMHNKRGLTGDEIMSVLPTFTTIREENTQAFINDLRTAYRSRNFDRFLILLRDSFSEFLYDEFSELEQHYREHLFIISEILKHEDEYICDFEPQDVVFFADSNSLITFNLRGSAEDALKKGAEWLKNKEGRGEIDHTIGASFSAFDRKIDRWVR